MTHTAKINTNFLNDWNPFEKLNRKVERAIFTKLNKGRYIWQPSHDEKSKRVFTPQTFGQIEDILGLAYTSTSAYAALWVCNGGYLWANNTHRFTGFAINTDGDVIAITEDMDESPMYINFSR